MTSHTDAPSFNHSACSALGRRAIVVGAGIGGLAAAAALAPFFEQVSIVDRDLLPSDTWPRAGVAQGHQVHALLAGGHLALDVLLAGFGTSLARRGAVAMSIGRDVLFEEPGYTPFLRRDFGLIAYGASRPLIEQVLRERCLALPNIELEQSVRVHRLLCEAGRVHGVMCKVGDGALQPREAELVVDASGSGQLTLASLKQLGMPLPPQSTIRIDADTVSARFEVPPGAMSDWMGCITLPAGPETARSALMLPIENECWLLGLRGRGDESPPADPQGFMAALDMLATRTIADAVRHAVRVGGFRRYRFVESVLREYHKLTHFPEGLVPLGDAICRFNPRDGQGMSVAAQEALALRELLLQHQRDRQPLRGLSSGYFQRCAELIETPWRMAALPDLAYSARTAEERARCDEALEFRRALLALAAQDPAVHKLWLEVIQLVKPQSVLRSGELGQRLREATRKAA